MKRIITIFALIMTGLSISLAANSMEVTRSSALVNFSNNVELNTCTMGIIKDLTGQTFGRLTAIKIVGTSKDRHKIWLCECECGGTTEVGNSSLKSGNTKSCGCLIKENKAIGERNRTHGLSRGDNSLYNIWRGIKKRCRLETDKDYPRYGAKGINITDEWFDSFEAFYRDMGERPSKDHSIDRIDNLKGYSKENCRWATRVEQQNNKNNNVLITFNGKTQTLAQWSVELGIKRKTLEIRLKNGWGIEKSFTTKVRKPKFYSYNKKQKKWRAYSNKVNGRYETLGCFDTETEAKACRLRYEKEVLNG
jgi:hypothetical protein